MKIIVVISLILSASGTFGSQNPDPLSDEFIDLINSKQNLWKAGRNFDENTSIEDLKMLVGTYEVNAAEKYQPTIHNENAHIPESFDARENWKECSKVIATIADQSQCRGCWAVATTSVMSDRRCIASNGSLTVPVSALDVLSCCDKCGNGCQGGSPDKAYEYWATDGIVTGGLYESNEGCKPYSLQNCDHQKGGKYVPCSSLNTTTPKCAKKCSVEGLEYDSEITFGKSPVLWLKTVDDIQKEIIKNGPVSAIITVYNDFISYKSGVYKYVTGDKRGNHNVRIIGWGTDEASKVPYWLVVNSWNEDWGDKGMVKFIKGENNCNIESSVFAALPKIE